MMNEIEEGTEVSHTAFSGLDKQRFNEDYAEKPPQDYDEEGNDESVIDNNEATTYATIGYSYITSNIKWFLIAIGSFGIFFGIGWGSGYEIGDAIFWGGDNNESSVSSAMAADFTTSDNNGGKSGKGEGGAKSGKSTSSKSGKSLKECVDFTVDIFTDFFPDQTSWKLLNMCTGEEQLSEDRETLYIDPFTSYSNNYCVPDSRYTFIIEDENPDIFGRDATGLDCSSETDCTGTDGPGNYTVTYDVNSITLKGAETASGGGKFSTQIPVFKGPDMSKESTTFGIPFDKPSKKKGPSCQSSPCQVAPSIAIPSSTQGTTIDDGTNGGGVPISSVQVAPACSGADVTAPTGAFYQVTGNGQNLVASTCGTDFDSQISVYNSCDFSQENICEAGNDDGGICGGSTGGFGSQVVWQALDGNDYYILVHGLDLETGDFELSVDEVDDDESVCESADTLALDTPVSGTTIGGPTVTGGFECTRSVFPGVNVAWYKVIGTGNELRAELTWEYVTGFDANFARISVFSSCDDIASSCVEASFYRSTRDLNTGGETIVEWQSVSGVDYYLMVHGSDGSVGSFELSLTELP